MCQVKFAKEEEQEEEEVAADKISIPGCTEMSESTKKYIYTFDSEDKLTHIMMCRKV
jgi:hypothetical protein